MLQDLDLFLEAEGSRSTESAWHARSLQTHCRDHWVKLSGQEAARWEWPVCVNVLKSKEQDSKPYLIAQYQPSLRGVSSANGCMFHAGTFVLKMYLTRSLCCHTGDIQQCHACVGDDQSRFFGRPGSVKLSRAHWYLSLLGFCHKIGGASNLHTIAGGSSERKCLMRETTLAKWSLMSIR